MEEIKIAIGAMGLFVIILMLLLLRTRRHLRKAVSQRQSTAARHGQIYEQYFPLLKDYPYESKDFRFLGTPVDGVQFTEDGIILVEFKSGTSRLSKKQKEIRKLVEEGKVRFEEYRVE
jgi:predicted Holliday junction resolvase-like endonuclease